MVKAVISSTSQYFSIKASHILFFICIFLVINQSTLLKELLVSRAYILPVEKTVSNLLFFIKVFNPIDTFERYIENKF
ncbi:MAG: hypothetical protein WCG25_00110 [bacterium]